MWWRCTKHQNHAKMGMVLIFGRLGTGGDMPNTKIAQCQCLAGKEVVDTCQALKICLSEYGFNFQQVGMWWTYTKY